MEVESKLIPILREGVDVVKMVFFRKLKPYIAGKYPEHDAQWGSRLCGAIINDLFGSSSGEEPFSTFAEANKTVIERETNALPGIFPEMRIPLTDALRIQTMCDFQEGMDTSFVLERARQSGILIVDRELPLPAPFMNLVRKLGSAFGLLVQE